MRFIIPTGLVLFCLFSVLTHAHSVLAQGGGADSGQAANYSQSSYNTGNNPGNNNAPGYNGGTSYSQGSYSSGGGGGADSGQASNGGSSNNGGTWRDYVPNVVESAVSRVWTGTVSSATRVFEAAQAIVNRGSTTYTPLPNGQYLSSDGQVTPTQNPINRPATGPVGTTPSNVAPVPDAIQAQIDAIEAEQTRSGVVTEVLTPTQEAILARAASELGANIGNPAVEATILSATHGMTVTEAIAALKKVEASTGGTINAAAINIAFGRSCGDANCAAAEQLRTLAGVGGIGGAAAGQANLEVQMQGIDDREQQAVRDAARDRLMELNEIPSSSNTNVVSRPDEGGSNSITPPEKPIDYSNTQYGNEQGQQLGTTYSGPKGVPTTGLSTDARQANVRAQGYDVPDITASEAEIEHMTRMVLAETSSIRNADGSLNLVGAQAVAEVMRNRVLSPSFPNNVTDVLLEPNQFSPANTGLQWSRQYAPGSVDYAQAEVMVRGVLNGEIAPIAVTDTGSAMVNYQNNNTVFNQPGYSSASTRASVATMLERGLTLTIFDATRSAIQHTFGNRGNPVVPDFTPDDAIAVNTRTFETSQPSAINTFRTTGAGRAAETVVHLLTNPIGTIAGFLGNIFSGGSSNTNTLNSNNSSDNDTPRTTTPPTVTGPVPATDLFSTANGATPTGNETESTIEYRFAGSVSRVIFEAEDGIPTTDINANYADTLVTSLAVDYRCDGTINATSSTKLAYTSFDPTEDTSRVLISQYVPVTEFGTHCFSFTADAAGVVTEKDETNNMSNVYRFIVSDEI